MRHALSRKGGFIGGAWPISGAALAALVDLGLPDEMIAQYFMIEPRSVVALRAHYGVERSASPSGQPD
ncbi:hypothetical protein [Inquilinus sp. OTU3971]|uniref:hypothetical protein n=1 Tax=Inquilinus sp. OTU3971 TaxID=3043855 RepID=UPI00313ECB0D